METELYNEIEIIYNESKQKSLDRMGIFVYSLLEKKIKEGLIEVTQEGKIIKLKEEKI
ncbi:MAG: hypothetical protein NC182_01800 [Prevotella sp.]|nr:hypothetical protein [Staphylococcus sp.]MCM1349917.1 hypothetical protein [Prevotella sp.]